MLPELRVARPTDNLEALAKQYREGLGLTESGRFEDHYGYDAVMLGEPGGAWHLEFTHRRGHAAGGEASGEHLLVLYLPDGDEWRTACERMRAAGFRSVASENPYWDAKGKTFADRDGYRVVLQNVAWNEK